MNHTGESNILINKKEFVQWRTAQNITIIGNDLDGTAAATDDGFVRVRAAVVAWLASPTLCRRCGTHGHALPPNAYAPTVFAAISHPQQTSTQRT